MRVNSKPDVNFVNQPAKMKIKGIKYKFTAKPWQYSGPGGGWHFVSLPVELAKKIRNALKSEEEAWGRLKATAKIGNSEWSTAIWFDTKRNTYLLPLKSEIRKKENLSGDKVVETVLWI
ncbi:MAG TPA: DUF1905 domain-containing protein [Chitinophagaceae bacterium]|nr:DUF1905 domain-containing protein [Chitinophagaceae bacterium]